MKFNEVLKSIKTRQKGFLKKIIKKFSHPAEIFWEFQFNRYICYWRKSEWNWRGLMQKEPLCGWVKQLPPLISLLILQVYQNKYITKNKCFKCWFGLWLITYKLISFMTSRFAFCNVSLYSLSLPSMGMMYYINSFSWIFLV